MRAMCGIHGRAGISVWLSVLPVQLENTRRVELAPQAERRGFVSTPREPPALGVCGGDRSSPGSPGIPAAGGRVAPGPWFVPWPRTRPHRGQAVGTCLPCMPRGRCRRSHAKRPGQTQGLGDISKPAVSGPDLQP